MRVFLALLVLIALSSLSFLQPFRPVIRISHPVVLNFFNSSFVKYVITTSEHNMELSCLNLARKHPEPYTREYRNQTIDLTGPMYAFHRWNETLSKYQIDHQKPTRATDCRILFKVLDGALYVFGGNNCYAEIQKKKHLQERYEKQVELIFLALEVYDVPDVDFVIELSDGMPPKDDKIGMLPVMSYCIHPPPDQERGFTYPSYGAYSTALGTEQMAFFQACQRQRYPFTSRIRKAVWRGSTTGNSLEAAHDVYMNRRVSLVQLGSYMVDILDVGVTNYVQANKSDAHVMGALKKLAPLRSPVKFQDFNNYTAVIDVDGNAWSDRLPQLLMSNTPVLKQEYHKWYEYFGHLLTNKQVRFFKEDLTDLTTITNEVLADYHSRRSKWEAMIAWSNAFAEEHVSHLGVIRAMAYAMTKYASFMTWTVEKEKGYVLVQPTQCCPHNPSLPKELVEKVRSRATPMNRVDK